MSEIQRYDIGARCLRDCFDCPVQDTVPIGSGYWVRFSDHDRIKAEAVRAAVTERDREWEARIEAKAAEYERYAQNHNDTASKFLDQHDDAAARGAFRLETDCLYIADLLRSLLSVDPNTEKGEE